MKSLKVLDQRPHSKRKGELYNVLGACGIYPGKVQVGEGVFYVLIRDEEVEEMLKEETKKKAVENGFQIFRPLDYDSMKTVVVRDVDSVMEEFTVEEIAEWAKVEEVVKLPTTSQILKVRFRTSSMAQKAMDKGIIVLNQSIAPWKVEREIFIKLTACNNCFAYEHYARNCLKEKKILCGYCGEEGHRQGQCKSEAPRCINCQGEHKTLAARCHVRKDLIKRRKEVRERSKSRIRENSQGGRVYGEGDQGQYQGETYAGVANGNERNDKQGMQSQERIRVLAEVTDLTTTIMTAIIYSHIQEVLMPGSFQSNMDKMYEANGLTKVRFPADINIKGMEKIYGNMLNKEQDKTGEGVRDGGVGRSHGGEAAGKEKTREKNKEPNETRIIELINEVVEESRETSGKRTRETISPQVSGEPKRTRNDPTGIRKTEGRGLLWDGVGDGVRGACALPIEGEEMEEEEVIYAKIKERKGSWESIRSEGRESLNLTGVGRGT